MEHSLPVYHQRLLEDLALALEEVSNLQHLEEDDELFEQRDHPQICKISIESIYNNVWIEIQQHIEPIALKFVLGLPTDKLPSRSNELNKTED